MTLANAYRSFCNPLGQRLSKTKNSPMLLRGEGVAEWFNELVLKTSALILSN